MTLVIFGLAISSSWGNGHATIWRALARALAGRGHRLVFFEHDQPYYAAHRDLTALSGGELVLYSSWDDVLPLALDAVRAGDLSGVTSYCPDAAAASDLVRRHARASAFYDLDTAVTLARLDRGETIEYLPDGALRGFDVVLSYTGGDALTQMRTRLGAERVWPLYGSADPATYRPQGDAAATAALSYLGTYSEDRHAAFERFLLSPAYARPDLQFRVGGPLYPDDRLWPANIEHHQHVAPADHPRFYAAARFTLNLTRGDMARLGYCPSGRLFEAAACETPILTDQWRGLETFFDIGTEVIALHDTASVLAALEMEEEQRRAIGRAARRRVLLSHTADVRAAALEQLMRDPAAALSA